MPSKKREKKKQNGGDPRWKRKKGKQVRVYSKDTQSTQALRVPCCLRGARVRAQRRWERLEGGADKYTIYTSLRKNRDTKRPRGREKKKKRDTTP